MPPTPVIKSFLIADSVFQQIDGKWCIIGVFQSIISSDFPCLHYSLGLFLKLGDAQGDYELLIELRDSEDHCLARMAGPAISVTERSAEVDLGIQTFAFPIPKPGVYFLKVYFNGQESLGDIRFEARSAEKKI